MIQPEAKSLSRQLGFGDVTYLRAVKKNIPYLFKKIRNDMPPGGSDNTSFRMGRTVGKLLGILYPTASSFVSARGTKIDRNTEIIQRYQNGETLETLAEVFRI